MTNLETHLKPEQWNNPDAIIKTNDSERLPVSAVFIMTLLCFLWGANAVSIKFSNQGMPPIMTAALRSLISGTLLWGYAGIKGRKVAFPAGQTRHALVHRHTVSRVASFTFMGPLFGLVLDEPVTLLIWAGLACVAGGLYGVNR